MQNNRQQLTNKVAVIEQSQQERQDTIEAMQENTQKVAARISTLGENLLKFQEILQNNIRELVGIIDVSGQEQLKFQEKIQRDLRALDDSVSAIKQSQNKLQRQIEDVQNRAEIMSSDVPAAIEQLEDELTRNGTLDSDSEIVEIEPSPPASSPAETNSVK